MWFERFGGELPTEQEWGWWIGKAIWIDVLASGLLFWSSTLGVKMFERMKHLG